MERPPRFNRAGVFWFLLAVMVGAILIEWTVG